MLTPDKFLKILQKENCEISVKNSEHLEDVVDSINYHFNLEDKLDSMITDAKDHIKDVSSSNVEMYLKEKQVNHWLAYISALESVKVFTKGYY